MSGAAAQPGGEGRRCAVCGAPARRPFQAPAAELAPDLDLRPGEPARSSLGRWIVTCRGCGASAPDLAALPKGAATVVAGADYRALAGGGAEQAALRWAAILEQCAEPAEAAQAILQAAWAVDDAGGDATALRRRAAALWGEPATMQDALRLLDVERRAGLFAAAAARVTALLGQPGLDETDATVLRFQQARIAASDVGRHLLSSALRPPARTPHATHARSVAPGSARSFWQRLVGR